ncbi:MAG: hypothetical protein MJZ38_01780 [archaeon]|nr:hypothetical protein [archaeon]
MSFAKPDVVDDNIYSQVWKTEYAIVAKARAFEFGCLRAAHLVSDDRMRIALLLERDALSPTCLRVGPAPWGKNSGNFLAKWRGAGCVGPFIRDGAWCAVVPRQHTDAKSMLIREMPQAGVGREIDLKTMEILDNDESLDRGDLALLTELLDPRHPWEF